MKKIAFLFTGQTRKNPLSTSTDVHEYILDGYTNFIFTPEFKSQYNTIMIYLYLPIILTYQKQ